MTVSLLIQVGEETLYKNLPNGSFFAVRNINGSISFFVKNGQKIATSFSSDKPQKIGVRNDEIVYRVEILGTNSIESEPIA